MIGDLICDDPTLESNTAAAMAHDAICFTKFGACFLEARAPHLQQMPGRGTYHLWIATEKCCVRTGALAHSSLMGDGT